MTLESGLCQKMNFDKFVSLRLTSHTFYLFERRPLSVSPCAETSCRLLPASMDKQAITQATSAPVSEIANLNRFFMCQVFQSKSKGVTCHCYWSKLCLTSLSIRSGFSWTLNWSNISSHIPGFFDSHNCVFLVDLVGLLASKGLIRLPTVKNDYLRASNYNKPIELRIIHHYNQANRVDYIACARDRIQNSILYSWLT